MFIANVEIVTIKTAIMEIKDLNILPKFDKCLSVNNSFTFELNMYLFSCAIGFSSTEIRNVIR